MLLLKILVTYNKGFRLAELSEQFSLNKTTFAAKTDFRGCNILSKFDVLLFIMKDRHKTHWHF